MGQTPTSRLQAYMPMGDLENTRDFSFTDIRGFQILNTTGHKVGAVKEVFVDPNTLEPAFALLNYDKGFRLRNNHTKHFLVPWEELILGENFVQTRWTEETLLPGTQAEQDENLAKFGGAGHRTDGSRPSASAADVHVDTESADGVLTPAGISSTPSVE